MKETLLQLGMAVGIAAVTVASAGSSAQAASITETGSGGRIPPIGSRGFFQSSVTVTEELIIDSLSVDLNRFFHTYSGDLQTSLSYDNGVDPVVTARLYNGVGGSTNLSGTYTFQDGGDSYNPSTGGIYAPLDSFASAFNGLNSAGTWTLSINDRFSLDTGRLRFMGSQC